MLYVYTGGNMKIIKFFTFLYIIFLFLLKPAYAENLPAWIISPDMSGYSYCATGSAPKNSNFSLQKKIARMNAMSELSKTIEISISNQLDIKSNVESSNNKQINVDKDISSTSRQRSNAVISNASELDSFLDNNTGIYYLRMCIK